MTWVKTRQLRADAIVPVFTVTLLASWVLMSAHRCSHGSFLIQADFRLCSMFDAITVFLETHFTKKTANSCVASHLINFCPFLSSQERQKAQHCSSNPALHPSPCLHRWVIQTTRSTLLYDSLSSPILRGISSDISLNCPNYERIALPQWQFWETA